MTSSNIAKYSCHSHWSLTCSLLGPCCYLSCRGSTCDVEGEGEGSADTLWECVWGFSCRAIWLTEGNAIMVLQQYRPTKSLQVSDSDEDFNIFSPASLQLHASRCLIKSGWCNRTETKPSHRITSGRRRRASLGLIDTQHHPGEFWSPLTSRCCEVPRSIFKVFVHEFNLTEANFGKMSGWL